MNARVTELRERSLATPPSISAERSLILTRFYREHLGRHSTPVLRALAFRELCERKTITIEPGELIVGERGPAPKATPLFPELTCHSTDDLRILDGRPLTHYDVPRGRDRRLRGRGHPVLARPQPARPPVRAPPPRVARRLRGRPVHRVHGAAGAGPHGGRRQDLRPRHGWTSRPTSTRPPPTSRSASTRAPAAASRSCGRCASPRTPPCASRSVTRSWPSAWPPTSRTPAAAPSSSGSRPSAAASRRMPPGTSGRRSRCTGSATWR